MNDPVLFSWRANDGSRNFADLPEIASFEAMRSHLWKLIDARETDFLTDHVTEMWLDFEYRGRSFSINNQFGDYWFFVNEPECPDEILLEVIRHFKLINPE